MMKEQRQLAVGLTAAEGSAAILILIPRNFNNMILKFSEKFDRPFLHSFIFGNMFPESNGFVAMPVTSCINDISSNLSQS